MLEQRELVQVGLPWIDPAGLVSVVALEDVHEWRLVRRLQLEALAPDELAEESIGAVAVEKRRDLVRPRAHPQLCRSKRGWIEAWWRKVPDELGRHHGTEGVWRVRWLCHCKRVEELTQRSDPKGALNLHVGELAAER